LLSVTDLEVVRENGSVAIAGASFDLRAGEILGLCGVEGNGQSELMQTLAGMLEPSRGSVSCKSRSVAHIPEDRLRHGVIPSMTLAGNWLLRHLDDPRFNRRGWLRWPQVRKILAQAVAAYDVKAPSVDARVDQLSGGNQQKLVLARELGQAPRVLLVGQPTRGVDIGAIEFIHGQLRALRAAGCAILLVSSELDEILSLADRVLVMNAGRITGERAVEACTEAELGLLMGQSHRAVEAEPA
jgi:simple sugar transport system ATP-binding protein